MAKRKYKPHPTMPLVVPIEKKPTAKKKPLPKAGIVARHCDCCTDDKGQPIQSGMEITRVLTLTDRDGVVLDQVRFCDNCWPDREIFIQEKSLSY